METLLYTLIFTVVVMFSMGIFLFLRSRDPALARMGVQGGAHDAPSHSLRKTRENERMDRFLAPFQERLKREQDEDTDEAVAEKTNLLTAAGYFSPRAGAALFAIRLTLAIVLSVALATFLFLGASTLSPIVATLIVVGGGAVGYYAPVLFVSSRASERKRLFSDGLPDALDLLLICLEAGLSFPAAMRYVAAEFRDVHPVISEHFEIVNLEFQAGRRRSDALRNLSRRVDMQELTSIVNMVNQSEKLGTSLTRAMRAAASDMRRDRMLRAEEKANSLPVRMSVPLVVCIFPTLFCIILVPVALRILEMFAATS